MQNIETKVFHAKSKIGAYLGVMIICAFFFGLGISSLILTGALYKLMGIVFSSIGIYLLSLFNKQLRPVKLEVTKDLVVIFVKNKPSIRYKFPDSCVSIGSEGNNIQVVLKSDTGSVILNPKEYHEENELLEIMENWIRIYTNSKADSKSITNSEIVDKKEYQEREKLDSQFFSVLLFIVFIAAIISFGEGNTKDTIFFFSIFIIGILTIFFAWIRKKKA
ncbi:MAG: hypothetical protein GY795_42100 [Desulfobacterales bacterium]|nr:hypothetical protein [Desulfobacterales bacterium]